MSSQAQIQANRANSQKSTGPSSADGKQAVSQNNLRHGLAGAFQLLAWENKAEFENLAAALLTEHNPQTATENILIERMVQHEWLRQRATILQNLCFSADGMIEKENDEAAFLSEPKTQKKFSLYLRYQTTHERGFHKCLLDLLKLRAARQKEQIGFESQERKRNEESRREADQARKQELQEARTRLANAKAAHLELDTDIKGTIQAVLPGHTPIDFNKVKGVLKIAIEEVFASREVRHKAA